TDAHHGGAGAACAGAAVSVPPGVQLHLRGGAGCGAPGRAYRWAGVGRCAREDGAGGRPERNVRRWITRLGEANTGDSPCTICRKRYILAMTWRVEFWTTACRASWNPSPWTSAPV